MSISSALKKHQQPNLQQIHVKLCPVKPPAGAKQVGNYILGKTIGSGNFGKVHLGLHILTGERVAVKIIDKTKLAAKDLERIHREIEILKRIAHGSLVQLYEIIETEKSLLFVTEYLQNGELFTHIIQNKKLAEEEACKIFQQVVDGIEYLHSIGIVHRDLKPENILLDHSGNAKIIDFGLSNIYKQNESLKTQCGSPCYAAPEMIEGKHRYEPVRVDIWSSGVVLFVMLTGTLPFIDKDITKLYNKIMTGNFEVPSFVSEPARDLITRMLAVDPSSRVSLKQIKQHPWYLKHQSTKTYGIDTRFYRVPVESKVLNNLKKMALNFPRLQESIELNIKNKQTALYYIILKKLLREGQPVPNFYGSPQFNKEVIEPLHKLADEGTSSTCAQVEMVPAVYMDSSLQSPMTSTGEEMFSANLLILHHLIKEFIAESASPADEKLQQLKGKFYANNKEMMNKKTNLRCRGVAEERLASNFKIKKRSKRSHTVADREYASNIYKHREQKTMETMRIYSVVSVMTKDYQSLRGKMRQKLAPLRPSRNQTRVQ